MDEFRSGRIQKPSETEVQIDAAKIELGVTFPETYRRFLITLGSHEGKDPPRGLWKAGEIVSLNRSLPVFRWFGGLIGIGNDGFLAYALDYRPGAEVSTPPVVSVGLSSSDWKDVVREADTFEEWLRKGSG